MKSHSDTTPSLRSFNRPDGVAVTGTLLALSQIAAPLAMGAEADKKKPDNAEKVEDLGALVVDAKTGKKLYKPENLSSPKYVTPLRDVAQTITVIPQEVIQDQAATTLTEVLRNVPGISVQAGEGGGASNTAGDAFNLRGFNGTNSVFVDGVRNESLISRDTYNLESVEAFLGPTGTDVGRGNAAGYINLATKTPKAEDFYRGTVAYYSGGTMRNTVDVNQTLGNGGMDWLGQTALRFNGLLQFGGVAGRDDVNKDSWSIAPSFALGLGTDTRIIFQFEHTIQDNTPDYGSPARNGYPLPGTSSEWFYGSSSDFEHVQQNSFTARIEHDFSENFKLINQTRYTEAERLAIFSAFGTNASYQTTRSRQGNERHNKVFNNQTILNAKFDTGPFKHSLSGGMELTWEEQYSPTLVGLGTYATTTYTGAPNPNFPIIGYNPHRDPLFQTTGATDTLGLFVSDTVQFAKYWQLSAGVRSDIYDTRYYARSATSATNPDGKVYGVAGDSLFSGKVALTFKPVEQGSIYLAYGTSQTPPGTANFSLSESSTNQNNPSLDPQESENIELGSKWDFFNDRLTLSGAVFHTENTNVIYASGTDNNGTTLYSLDGGQTIDGVTFGAAGKITEDWMIQANVTHLNAELDQPGNANDGRDLTLTPEISGSLWTTYRLPVLSKKLTVGAGLRYQDNVSVNAANTIHVPSYAVVDAMAKYEVSENISIQGNIYNLLDRDYRVSVNNNGQRYNAGAPLSFALITSFAF